jgi:ABC-2 type transport system ATP-binding protein
MDYAIVTRRLTKYYGRRAVVRDLELRVPRGCVYGLLGRNGAGKSTALKMMMGMVQPDYGHVELLGHDLTELTPETRSRIAYLAEGHPMYNGMTIAQAIELTRPFYQRWNPRLVDQVLDHFSLARRSKIGRLSKGQRAQVSLMLALATDPELLVLDDPTLGLDTNVRRDFLESIVALVQRQGRTILFSSHILADVERIADRVGVMIDGVLRADCATERFKAAVRKVVVEFAGEPPPLPVCPGLVGESRLGGRMELTFVDFGASQQAALEALEPVRIEVMELDLEEAFIEYTRGRREPLPAWGEESTV